MKTLAALVLALTVGCSTAPSAPAAPAPVVVAAHAPTCAVSMSAPFAVEGANFFGTGTLHDCNETDWNGLLQLRFSTGAFWAGIDIDRTQAAPGNTLDLGVEAVAFTSDFGPCEGTVTWTSDEPDWALSVNAVCHGEKGDYNFVADAHGHVYNGNN